MIALALLAWTASADEIGGTVRLHGTGAPLADITVRTESTDERVDTDDDGVWAIDLEPGEWRLWFESADHDPVAVDLVIPASEPVDVFLHEAKRYEIVVESFKTTSHISRHVVDAEMALETPGTLEDSVRLVQSLPGVTVRREYSPGQADLSVRGSSPGDNRYMLDGVDVPYLYHFNQYASVFPTTQIDTLELFPSTFGSRYGDAVGAVIDATSRQERPDTLHGSVAMSTVMGSAAVSLPLGDGDWWMSASARRSYQDLVSSGNPQFTLWPRFGDYSLRAGRDTDKTSLQLFAWGAGDAYDRAAGELDLLDPVEAADVPTFGYRRAFQVAGMQAGRTLNVGTRTDVVAVVHDRLRGRLSGNGEQILETTRLNQRSDWDLRVSPRWQFQGGWNWRGDTTRLQVLDPGDDTALVGREAPALGRGVAVDAAAVRLRGAVYSEFHHKGDKLRIMPGVRVPVDTMRLPLLPEPRLAVRWRAGDQTAVKVAVGRYQQVADTEHLLPGTGNPDLPATGSWQAGLGIEQTVAERLEFTVDAYGKTLDNPVVFPLDEPAFVGERGHAWGVELVSRYRLRETFFLWGWLAVAQSRVVQEPGGDLLPTDGDQPITAGIVGSWDPGKGWNLGLRYRFGSGLPYTPTAGSLYDAGHDTWVPVLGTLNSERFPAYQKADVHIEKSWEFNRWTLSFYTEAWYVPKKAAQLYPTWNYDYREQGWVVGPTFLPLFGARARF